MNEIKQLADALDAVVKGLLAREFLERQQGITEEEAIGRAEALFAECRSEPVSPASFLAMLRLARERAWLEN